MIKHIDFTPKVTKKGGLFKSAEIEKFQDIVDLMNEWCEANKPEIISIETVVLLGIAEELSENTENLNLSVPIIKNRADMVIKKLQLDVTLTDEKLVNILRNLEDYITCQKNSYALLKPIPKKLLYRRIFTSKTTQEQFSDDISGQQRDNSYSKT